MDGIHDMGGMDGFGKVEVEQNEPPFHEKWEGRVMAMQRAMGFAGAWHIDHARYAQERIAPHHLSRSVLLSEMGAGDGDQRGRARPRRRRRDRSRPRAAARQGAAAQVHRRSGAGAADARLVLPAGRRRKRASSPATACAPRIFIRSRIRGCRATRATRSASSSASTAATCFRTRSPRNWATIRSGSTRWCSTVAELWGPDSDPTLKVSIEAFEPYLEQAVIVVPGLVPGTPLRMAQCPPKRDGRDKPGHDRDEVSDVT